MFYTTLHLYLVTQEVSNLFSGEALKASRCKQDSQALQTHI